MDRRNSFGNLKFKHMRASLHIFLAYLYKQAGLKLIDIDEPIMNHLPSDLMAIFQPK